MTDDQIVVNKMEYDDFSWGTPWRNFEIICEGSSLYVNPGWLAEMSEFFKERCRTENNLVIEYVPYNELLEFFQCIFYCPMRKSLSSNNILIVYRLSKLFKMPTVTARCNIFLKNAVKNFDRNKLVQAARELGDDSNSHTMSLIVDRIANLSDYDLSTMEFSELPGDIVANVFNNHHMKKQKKNKKRGGICSIM
ncbi:unnamed protein product, partial [Mesorhabditis belari]|uniref:BTB domain-containing protein n=1 Tax=Mesorhabditis belari TaxID=2138241 RepID=A0AAF3JAM6_9BILA